MSIMKGLIEVKNILRSPPNRGIIKLEIIK